MVATLRSPGATKVSKYVCVREIRGVGKGNGGDEMKKKRGLRILCTTVMRGRDY